jgi:hypothetical protein
VDLDFWRKKYIMVAYAIVAILVSSELVAFTLFYMVASSAESEIIMD